MTEADEWERDLEVVANEIKTLKIRLKNSTNNSKKSLQTHKIQLLQGQMGLERTLTRIGKLTGRDYLLLPRDRTMLHWGRVYKEQLLKLASLQTKVANQRMWLKLIKTRLGAPNCAATAPVEAEDLLTLAIRQKDLLATEKALSKELVALNAKKKSLYQRYEHFEITQANRLASGSLAARLGANVDDALASPEMRALEIFIQKLTSALRDTDTSAISVQKSKFADRAARLLAEVKEIVIQTTQESNIDADTQINITAGEKFDEFEAALRELGNLEAETRAAYDKLLAASPASAHPQVVGKRPRPSTQMARSSEGPGDRA